MNTEQQNPSTPTDAEIDALLTNYRDERCPQCGHHIFGNGYLCRSCYELNRPD